MNGCEGLKLDLLILASYEGNYFGLETTCPQGTESVECQDDYRCISIMEEHRNLRRGLSVIQLHQRPNRRGSHAGVAILEKPQNAWSRVVSTQRADGRVDKAGFLLRLRSVKRRDYKRVQCRIR